MVVAGGRCDGLIEPVGGRPTAVDGFETGFGRISLNMKRQDAPLPKASKLDVFVAC